MNISFLDLKNINQQYRNELIEACSRVVDSGWYIGGKELESFESNFAELIIIKPRNISLQNLTNYLIK